MKATNSLFGAAIKQVGTKFLLAGAVLALIFVAAAPRASADTYNFNVQNGGLSAPGPWGTITMTQDGSNVDVTITAAAGLSIFGSQGAIAFADSGLTITGITDNGPGVFVSTGTGCNMDGFGSGVSAFGSCITDGNLGTGAASSVSFAVDAITIAQLENTNSKGWWVALHIGPTGGGNGCTGYVSLTINNNNTNSSTGTSTCTPVPEPSTVAMVGTGAAGVALMAIFEPGILGFRRRRLFA